MRWCWVNFQCRGVLLIWIRVGQGPTALAVGAGGGCLDIFSLVYHFTFLSPSLWETARYRLKYCLKGPLSPKQPTNHPPDFDLFPKLKEPLRGVRYDSLDELECAVNTEVRRINFSCIASGIEALPSRWNSVIRSRGDYFEGL